MLGVSIETLRRWETDGRLRMERSEGGQRLIEIDEVARLLEERRKASTDRPIVAQSARNRFPGIVTRIETRPGRRRRRGHRRSAPDGQPHDRRGRRRARPEGRRRGGLRRQVDERHRRDPFVQGGAGLRSRSSLLRRTLPSSWRLLGRRRVAVSARAPRRADAGRASEPSSSRSMAPPHSRAPSTRPRPLMRRPIPGTTADDLDGLLVHTRDADRAGRARRRLPVRRHDEPQEARRRGRRGRRCRSPSRATS